MRYCRPEIDDGDAFRIVGGRHPVVEQALASEGKRFIANDADLSEEHRLWLLTGPNMAGKSTFLRQNALIAILAQAGSFVPPSAPISASSTGCSPASAPPTIWRAAARPSWSRWSRPPRSCTRRPSAAW